MCGTPATGASFSQQRISITVSHTATGVALPLAAGIPATVTPDGLWSVQLPSQPEGGDLSITASCASGCANATDATIEHVTMGDVWYCAGQSNTPGR